MDENKNVLEIHKEPVPYIVYEEEMARAERRDRRHWILEIILVILLVASNLSWIVYENQFEDVVITQENTDGFNSYIGNDGDIYNGYTDNQETNP